MTDYRCIFSTSDRHRKLNQLCWQNVSTHLTNKTSYWPKKLLMHLNWAIYNVSDSNIDPHVCFFPTLSQDQARPIPFAQPEACPQRSERPVCARSPYRSRNGYPGWNWSWFILDNKEIDNDAKTFSSNREEIVISRRVLNGTISMSISRFIMNMVKTQKYLKDVFTSCVNSSPI